MDKRDFIATVLTTAHLHAHVLIQCFKKVLLIFPITLWFVMDFSVLNPFIAFIRFF